MCTPVEAEVGISKTLHVPDLPTVEVMRQDNGPGIGTWLVFTACGFGTENAAMRAGEKFGETLLIAGVIAKLGVDIGFSRSTRQFSKQIHEEVRQTTGRELQPEIHGLMTFEKDTISINRMVMRLSGSINERMFEERITPWADRREPLTERQKNCAALLNDSFFTTNTEGQFILRISAVEALCDQSDVGAEYQAVIGSLKEHLASLSIEDDSTRSTVKQWLENVSRKSIRQSYMTKFGKRLSEDDAKAFDKLYRQRGKLVHDGLGRGDLLNAASQALDLGVKLFEAELRAG